MDALAGTSSGDVTQAELRLAARNHGMPVEAAAWRLEVGGAVERAASLSLAELRALPAVTRRVTLECAGNGRALLAPRPLSQPWLTEAVGTGEWTGVPLRVVLEAAGVAGDAVEVLFTGLDRGIEGEVE